MARCIIGIDEVGRGALAGPVVVCAAMITGRWPGGAASQLAAPSGTLKDSKKLSAKQREAWYAHFVAHPGVSFAVARVYPRGIERMNISAAANLAALRAYKKLTAMGGARGAAKISAVAPIATFLDGGLFLGNGKLKRENPYRATTIAKADENISAVAIASIIAKVHRDRFMIKLAKQCPEYGFAIHKGYGTKAHRTAIKESGPTKFHRKTFLAKIV